MIPTTAVIKNPIVTEKTVAAVGKYTFVVHSEATKSDVVRAVKEFYNVDVEKVNISYVRSKQRVVGKGRTLTKRSEEKKATVTLKTGATLDFNSFK